MLSDVTGISVGHWTDPVARTGCTVVVLPPGTVASGEVRGGAPATREFALLDPARRVDAVDAVVLSGGSAFGLAAADGVMQWLEEQGRGFETTGGRVPIVVSMCLYDLAVGDGRVRPGAPQGYSACTAAGSGVHDIGLVGAGTGATVGKWLGRDKATRGGIGVATIRSNALIVSALVVVNAFGLIDNGSSTEDLGPPAFVVADQEAFTNTTIGVIATNAVVNKLDCLRIAQSGHDGLARGLLPAHTDADGDALVAVGTGGVSADPWHVRLLAQQAVTRAVRSVAAVVPNPVVTQRR